MGPQGERGPIGFPGFPGSKGQLGSTGTEVAYSSTVKDLFLVPICIIMCVQ